MVLHRLELDGSEVRVRLATLVAVARAETPDTDWEVIAECVERPPVGPGRVAVDMVCVTGADPGGHPVLGRYSGPAVVVRIIDRTLVLRGDGPLAGLTVDQLQG